MRQHIFSEEFKKLNTFRGQQSALCHAMKNNTNRQRVVTPVQIIYILLIASTLVFTTTFVLNITV